jgi:hypothetical protein
MNEIQNEKKNFLFQFHGCRIFQEIFYVTCWFDNSSH